MSAGASRAKSPFCRAAKNAEWENPALCGLVPAAHYPRSFGLLAADATIAGLAFLGVKPVADILSPFIFVSACAVAAIYVWRDALGSSNKVKLIQCRCPQLHADWMEMW